jgi:hypothetical protein
VREWTNLLAQHVLSLDVPPNLTLATMTKLWTKWWTSVKVAKTEDPQLFTRGGGGVLLSILVFLGWLAVLEKETGRRGTAVSRAVDHIIKATSTKAPVVMSAAAPATKPAQKKRKL